MAKRKREALNEEDKRPLSKANLKKFLGIFRFALPYKWSFIVGLVSLVLSSITLLAFPYYAGKLLDLASGKSSPYFTSINDVALFLVGILFVQSIFSFIRVYTFTSVSERTLGDVRQSVYQKIVWLPMTFFDQNRVGELMSRMTSDVSTLQETFTTSLAELLRQIITLIFGIGLIFYLTPSLTAFMLLVFPALIVVALIFGKFIRKLSRKTQDKLADANVVAEESLQSIAVVKAFTNELFEVIRYKRAVLEAVTVAIRAARFRGLFISFIIFAIFGGIVAVSWYGARLVQSGDITTGELLSFVLYTTFIGGSMAGLGDIYTQLQRAIGASERILEILQQEDEASASSREDKLKLEGNIEFKDVTFAYPSRPEISVLQNFDLSIHAGEKVALVGKSGSGKSTIISLILRFYEAQQGAVLVDGKNLSSYPLSAYRENMGIVPQEVILFGGTIGENIAYGKPGSTLQEIKEAARQANALSFIEGFPDGFDTLVGDRGVKLSGGQRQRIAIARAILKNPAILILDEATSSLDAHSEMLVQEALEKLMEGRTTIVIAHRLSTIKKVDRIFVIKDGRLAETGSHDELAGVNNGLYRNLLKLQLQ